MLASSVQALILVVGLGWAGFRIFRPMRKDALLSDRKVRAKERILFGIGLVLFFGGIPLGIYLSALMTNWNINFWLRFGLEMIPSFCGCGLIGWALFLNLREFGLGY